MNDDDNATPKEEPLAASRAFLSDALSGHAHTWEDFKFLRQHWDAAVVLKGIRTGADIMKALCLGAQAVLVDRPVMYGLRIEGMEGARHVLAGLPADLDQSMGLASVKRIDELTRDRLRRVAYGGGAKASL